MLLNALSQQWLFALYELLRIWRERAKDVVKWHVNGGLELKAEALESEKEGAISGASHSLTRCDG
jgi:hypothetical protein